MKRARAGALKRYRGNARRRAVALRSVARAAAQGRARCLSRFGRTPGRVTRLSAKVGPAGKIILSFLAPASDGSSPPAARKYVIKQALRPIRTAADFNRAPALCKGACTFDVTRLNAAITLEVTDLRSRTTYYYSVAARDNVSKRLGPRSQTVWSRTG